MEGNPHYTSGGLAIEPIGPVVAEAPIKLSMPRVHQILELLFHRAALLSAVLSPLIVAAMLVILVKGAQPALEAFGLDFFTTAAWDPVAENFGGAIALFGTVVTSAIAILLAVPISFGIALFLTELSPIWLKRPLGTLIELLAAIPSIIYGMWGLFVLAPVMADHVQPFLMETLGGVPLIGALFSGPPMGIGILTASIILAIMIIPYIASVMRDVFETVPRLMRESAYGMGATTSEVAWNVTLPYCRAGVVGGIMLGLGRALGETMAVTFVIGNAHEMSASLMMPGSTISSVLANEFTEAIGAMYSSALVALGLALFLLTFVVIGVSKLLLLRYQKARVI